MAARRGANVVPPRIVLANDHRGSRLKRELRERLEQEGHEIVDLGTDGEEVSVE